MGKQTVLPKPNFKATLESSVACINMEVEVDARADVMFNLLADPQKHPVIFDAIEGATCKLVEESGPLRKYELNYQARWKFWRVSGLCENRLYMTTDSDAGTVSFKLREPGFLKVYEGTWRITPSGSAALNLYSASNNTTPCLSRKPSLQGPLASMQPFQDEMQPTGGVAKTLYSMFQRAFSPLTSLSSQWSLFASPPSFSSAPSERQASATRLPWADLFSRLHVKGSEPSHSGRAGLVASINNPLLDAQHPHHEGGPIKTPSSHPLSARPSLEATNGLHVAPLKEELGKGSSLLDDRLNDKLKLLQAPPPLPAVDKAEAQGTQSFEYVTLPDMPSKTTVRVQGMRMAPKLSPPYPLGGLLKGHAMGQVEEMLYGLLKAAQKAQAELPPQCTASPSRSPYKHSDSSSSLESSSLGASSVAASTPRSSTSVDGSVTNSAPATPGSARALKGKPGAPRRLGSHRISVSDDGDQ